MRYQFLGFPVRQTGTIYMSITTFGGLNFLQFISSKHVVFLTVKAKYF